MSFLTPDRRVALIVALVVAGAVVLFGAGMQGPPSLGAVMAEVDGVHPVRAAAAVERAYVVGGGFLDKYPPLGGFLMGIAGRFSDPGFGEVVAGVEDLAPGPRREALFEVGDRIAALVALERRCSLGMVALALGLLAAGVVAGARRLGFSVPAAVTGALFAALVFGSADVVVYHATSTNVDAAVLLAGIVTLLAAACGRFRTAAVALGLAVAIKDPAFVLGPMVLAAAFARGGARLLLPTAFMALGVYAVAAGALTGPSLWWEHVVYLWHGGVEQVDRIDHGVLSDWAGLARLVERLLRDALGPMGLALAVLGLVVARDLPGRGPSRPDRLAVILIGSTLLFFVFPVGFVYARFLLLPMAVLAALGGLALAAGCHRFGTPAIVVLAVLIAGQGFAPAAFFGSRELGPLWWHRAEQPPRLAAAALLEREWPAGSTVVLFADEREHGPPLDPRDWVLDVRGLNDLLPSVTAWRAGEQPAPDAVVIMTFPTDPPSGRAADPSVPPRVGGRVAGLLDVVAVFGVPTGSRAEASLPWRPTVTVLRAAD